LATQVKLTSLAKAAGCAAKLNPATLDAVLRKLPRQTDPNVLVGFDTNDDAGIYRISEELALVQTVDFFTPIVDDPYLFGQIAAAARYRRFPSWAFRKSKILPFSSKSFAAVSPK
jgi:selenide,water dikinase